MNELLDEFDELELREQREWSEKASSSKGKAPRDEHDIASDEEVENSAFECPDSPSKASEPGDLTCAICLHDIKLEDLAMVKGCDHIYCANCILHWALHKEHPWCPQCKQPFNYLLTYRGIDGELYDFPVEESVVLLKRARWFEDSMKSHDHTLALLQDSYAADDTAWHDYADDYDFGEDEEIESFYFSSAAGQARVCLGNRRFGEGGFISAGRRNARPLPRQQGKSLSRRNSSKGKGSGSKDIRGVGDIAVVSAAGAGGGVSENTANSNTSPHSVAAMQRSSSSSLLPPLPPPPSSSSSFSSSISVPQILPTPNAHGGRKAMGRSSPIFAGSPVQSFELMMGTSPQFYGSSPSGSGRRARRNARRAAAAAAAAAGTSVGVVVPESSSPLLANE